MAEAQEIPVQNLKTKPPVAIEESALVRQVKVLRRLLKTRHQMGFKSTAERFAFYFQLNPVLNMFFCSWFSALKDGQSLMARAARSLVRGGFGFGALRHMTPEARNQFSEKVLGIQPAIDLHSIEKSDPQLAKAIAELRTQGYTKVGNLFDSKTIEDLKNQFGSCVHYMSQVYSQSDGRPHQKDWRDYGTNPPFRYVSFKAADSERILSGFHGFESMKKIADTYCRFPTERYGMNTFCTLPGQAKDYAMRMHRDYDDFGCLTFFIAWTKTSAEDGATIFVPNSHRLSSAQSPVAYLNAEPGDVFAVDTFGLHAGNSAVQNPRLATWIRYGRPVNLATIQDGV